MLSAKINMDPNQSLPGINPVPTNEPATPAGKITESSKSFIKNHYETYIRMLVKLGFSLINFIKFSLIKIISQVINKE